MPLASVAYFSFFCRGCRQTTEVRWNHHPFSSDLHCPTSYVLLSTNWVCWVRDRGTWLNAVNVHSHVKQTPQNPSQQTEKGRNHR